MVSQGKTVEEAKANLKEAVELYLESFGEEELESIRAYDAAKASGDEAIPFEQATSEIENS